MLGKHKFSSYCAMAFTVARVGLISNRVVSVISILTGLFLSYESASLFYLYEFTSRLFLFMVPMYILVVAFVLGLIATLAGLLLLGNRPSCLAMFYTFAAGLLSLALIQWSDSDNGFPPVPAILLYGYPAFIFVYFNLPAVLGSLNKIRQVKDLLAGLAAGISIPVVSMLLFRGYGYS